MKKISLALSAAQVILLLSGCSESAESIARRLPQDVLKDPDSAKYKNLVTSQDKKAVCGEVNSKNSYGAYVGFEESWILMTMTSRFL